MDWLKCSRDNLTVGMTWDISTFLGRRLVDSRGCTFTNCHENVRVDTKGRSNGLLSSGLTTWFLKQLPSILLKQVGRPAVCFFLEGHCHFYCKEFYCKMISLESA